MRLATIKDVSLFLCVKESTLYSWVHNGSIPFHKLNGLVRFDMDEIEAWIKSSRSVSFSLDIGPKKTAGPGIDRIIRQAIDGSKGKAYNPSNGKPGLHQGLRKED
jgi:excisionase family DNA binding protein